MLAAAVLAPPSLAVKLASRALASTLALLLAARNSLWGPLTACAEVAAASRELASTQALVLFVARQRLLPLSAFSELASSLAPLAAFAELVAAAALRQLRLTSWTLALVAARQGLCLPIAQSSRAGELARSAALLALASSLAAASWRSLVAVASLVEAEAETDAPGRQGQVATALRQGLQSSRDLMTKQLPP